jgi:hypothetical protein
MKGPNVDFAALCPELRAWVKDQAVQLTIIRDNSESPSCNVSQTSNVEST